MLIIHPINDYRVNLHDRLTLLESSKFLSSSIEGIGFIKSDPGNGVGECVNVGVVDIDCV